MDDDKIFGDDLVEDEITSKKSLLPDNDIVDENLEDGELEEGTDSEEEEDEY